MIKTQFLPMTIHRKLPIYECLSEEEKYQQLRQQWKTGLSGSSLSSLSSRLSIVHCGYKIELSDEVVKKFAKYVPTHTFGSAAYTAVLHVGKTKTKGEMLMWLSSAKTCDGFITHLIVTKKDVICKINIRSKLNTAILVHTSKMTRKELKNSFGMTIPICEPRDDDPTINDTKITVPCHPVFFAQETQRYHNIFGELVVM